MSGVDRILAERQNTHGDFSDNARLIQALKRMCHEASDARQGMGDIHREALDMILHKIGRICSGDPNVKDHWDDIAGYATLVSQRIKT